MRLTAPDVPTPIRHALVVASPHDGGALAVGAALRRRLGQSVRVLSPEELVLSPRWVHAVSDEGDSTETTLADGLVLRDREIRFVLCRVRALSAPHFARSLPDDRDYAVSELHALFLSWLASLPCPVVNRPHAQGLAGRERSPFEWLALAARAGLRVRGFSLTTNARRDPCPGWIPHGVADGVRLWSFDASPSLPRALLGRSPTLFLEPIGPPCPRALVVGGDVLGDVPAHVASGCLRLAASVGCELLEVRFGTGRGGDLRVTDVTHFPPLEARPEADCVADWLVSKTTSVSEAA